MKLIEIFLLPSGKGRRILHRATAFQMNFKTILFLIKNLSITSKFLHFSIYTIFFSTIRIPLILTHYYLKADPGHI
jgi:hypothetical protein